MKRLSLRHRRRVLAFTIVELLVVIGIIALLGSLAMPNFGVMIQRANSVRCSENLHGIGIAVLACATDNNGFLPEIDQAGGTNVYLPPGSVQGLVGVLGKYGVSTNTIQCPVDMELGPNCCFTLYQSSYEWNPLLDDDTDPPNPVPLTAPFFVGGQIQINVNASRIRVCTDFNSIHRGKKNALYADGHTRAR